MTNADAIGDNQGPLIQEYVTRRVEWEKKITAIRGKMSTDLNKAKKDDKLSKLAIKSAVKKLKRTAEQRQSDNNVEAEAERYFELCKDLPLFATASEDRGDVSKVGQSNAKAA